MIKFFKAFKLTYRFFIALGIVMALFALSFGFETLFPLAQSLACAVFAFAISDAIILFGRNGTVSAERQVTPQLSLGDKNEVLLRIANLFKLKISIEIFDELPVQFQQRNFGLKAKLAPGDERTIGYDIQPTERGNYDFGSTNIIVQTMLGMVERRIEVNNQERVKTYPSVIQMKKYELKAFAKTANFEGIKKVRRLGHSYEFEQIKAYVQGDDYRSINWKATSRRNQLMVNQYEDERSQQVYSILDKSRAMHMPFNGMSLLDYAINSTLVISNIALKKHDRVGLISYSNTIGSTIKAEKRPTQIRKLYEALYNEQEQVREANLDLLYRGVKNVLGSRSLIFLYTNFESSYALERALPVLKKINKQHLLVVMMFENTELIEYSRKQVVYMSDIYTQTIAERLTQEKKQMASQLKKNGIQTILSAPEELSINTVNKYLELKSKGLI